ncbi:alpha/beta fold hydrolase [Nocardia sp. ET3-3]|uniref:Alpha/beta fold hydrolase n=1 Tax=Nocardia terrae TaxID=2675851 RepID=A0A7K1V5G2_9NOCA|nr:alpha/beta fold hydrolase [Nocardia terrae]MVU81328.1 alpha/beta fold hydrolase [Nocardia terrae]
MTELDSPPLPRTPPHVRSITIDAGDVDLSGLIAVPDRRPARALIVAIHGAGMRAGYFDGRAHPDVSLLSLGAHHGFVVAAIDRPGYGISASSLPHGQSLIDQATALAAALNDLTARFDSGAGILLHAHSFGAKLALVTAAHHRRDDLLGVDISGCGHRYAQLLEPLTDLRHLRARNWGPLTSYPPGTFESARALVAPVPFREIHEISSWERVFPAVAQQISVPVRFTFAEHEPWWRHDPKTLADLCDHLPNSPFVAIDHQRGAGHNVSLGYSARTYHLRSLAFAEECMYLMSARNAAESRRG